MSTTNLSTAATVARNLKLWRAAHGVDQRRLAQLYGASQTRISFIEDGKLELRSSTLDRLAKATGMTVAELVSHRPIPGHVIDQPQG